MDINISYEIERLLNFGIENDLINEWDKVVVRNELLDLFNISKPYKEELELEGLDQPNEILNIMIDYACINGIIENDIINRDIFDSKIMGLLTPRQSEVIRRFFNSAKEKNMEYATNEFYHMSKATNYIRQDRIAKNLYWEAETFYGDLEITINLSKPEKDPKIIAKLKEMKSSSYPKCLLCKENIGYAGRLNHPARKNHRVIPIILGGESWFLQFSPYVYYRAHCIVIYEKHIPMKMSDEAFICLFDFVDMFPHYFIGANADLPIVGGSILSHEHFQGGGHIFPMEKAKIEKRFILKDQNDISFGAVKWPMTTLRIRSLNKEKIIKFANEIYIKWKDYEDKGLEIIPYTEKEGKIIPHNTITPILRKKGEMYELDIVFRNNRTNEQHPYGIFHPHTNLHHIKKENIGLVEVMGLAVLPGRLEKELKLIENFLVDNNKFKKEKYLDDEMIGKHCDWIESLINKYGNIKKDEVNKILQKEVGERFKEVLEDAGVFKRNKEGQEGFERFLKEINLYEK